MRTCSISSVFWPKCGAVNMDIIRSIRQLLVVHLLCLDAFGGLSVCLSAYALFMHITVFVGGFPCCAAVWRTLICCETSCTCAMSTCRRTSWTTWAHLDGSTTCWLLVLTSICSPVQSLCSSDATSRSPASPTTGWRAATAPRIQCSTISVSTVSFHDVLTLFRITVFTLFLWLIKLR